MYWYRIFIGKKSGRYYPQYRRGIDAPWNTYNVEGSKDTWEKAYAVLEQHATPAKLAVRFVGTF